jgi:hypothetical protein
VGGVFGHAFERILVVRDFDELLPQLNYDAWRSTSITLERLTNTSTMPLVYKGLNELKYEAWEIALNSRGTDRFFTK